MSGAERIARAGSDGDLLAEVLLVGLVERRELHEIAEVLAAYVTIVVHHDPVPLPGGDDLSPPDPWRAGIACTPKELLNGAPAVQSTDREVFTQVAHTTRIGPRSHLDPG